MSILRFDGASKGNPGLGGSAGVLYKDGNIVKYCYYYHSTPVTNNVAEYYGLIIGMRSALLHGYDNITIEGDSKLVIEQVFGSWKCKHQNIIPLYNEALALKKQFKSIHGRWIAREKNTDADRYCNEAVEKQCHYGESEEFCLSPTTKKIEKVLTTKTKQLTITEAFKAVNINK